MLSDRLRSKSEGQAGCGASCVQKSDPAYLAGPVAHEAVIERAMEDTPRTKITSCPRYRAYCARNQNRTQDARYPALEVQIERMMRDTVRSKPESRARCRKSFVQKANRAYDVRDLEDRDHRGAQEHLKKYFVLPNP